MAAENGASSGRLVETEKTLLKVMQQHNAFQKQVDTALGRFAQDMDKVVEQLKSAVSDLRTSISTTPNEFAETIEHLRARVEADEKFKARRGNLSGIIKEP